MPNDPEPRFEVPPEYAEVYERAYRRAYEQGLGVQPTSGTVLAPPPQPRKGRRMAVPRQRGATEEIAVPRRGGARRAAPAEQEPPVAPEVENDVDTDDVAGAEVAVPEPTPEPARGPMQQTPRRRGHRGVPRTGSTWVPLLVLLALALMLIAGAFVLGRVTADTGEATAGDTASVTAATTPTPYDGATAPLHPDAVASGCTASPAVDPQGAAVGYDASNVLDDDPGTAWRCDTTAVGQVLDFTMPRHSRVVAVGLVPGLAVTDPVSGVDLYANNNRVTRVLWTFDDGTSVTQDIAAGTQDRSLRMLRIPETTSTHVSMKILTVDPGPSGATTISTVAFSMAADGAS